MDVCIYNKYECGVIIRGRRIKIENHQLKSIDNKNYVITS